MQPAMKTALDLITERVDLDQDQANAAVSAIMDGECEGVEIAAFLTGLRVKGEASSELVGAARAMRERAAKIPTTQTGLLDTCGTGGDCLHTFNISTATALVAAAAGVHVAKHGNRSVSSSSGSADVIEKLGINVQLSPEQVGACMDQVGIGFCFAPLFHGAMKYAAPIRKQLGFRTIFNLLGPLCNPAGASFQLLGANTVANAQLIAGALSQLGAERALVVCGNDELDEVSLWGETTVFDVRGDSITEEKWTAASFGLSECSVDALKVDTADASAAVVQGVFNGESGPAADIVVANAAAALYVAGRVGDLEEAAGQARETISSGAAAGLLAKLAELSNA
ncbi:MAG: anthranilate phosphoribosyltransferase [Planctomycetaceae bacterium]|nr:anthranilate phosphoribosyltransferase [Planctomycetaceae bacterium]